MASSLVWQKTVPITWLRAADTELHISGFITKAVDETNLDYLTHSNLFRKT